MLKEYYIIKDRSKLQIESIKGLMKQTYCATDRSEETIVKSIKNSACYGIFDNCDNQVGFARVITDYYYCIAHTISRPLKSLKSKPPLIKKMCGG